MKHPTFRYLICSVLFAAFTVVTIPANDLSIAEVKSKILDLASKQTVHARIKLKSGEVLQGHIVSPEDDDFILVTKERAQAFSYSDVAEVSRLGFPQTLKISIVETIVSGAALVLMH